MKKTKGQKGVLIHYFSIKMMEEPSLLLHLQQFVVPWGHGTERSQWVARGDPPAVFPLLLSFSYSEIIVDSHEVAEVAQRGPTCPRGPCLSLRVACPSALLGVGRGEPCLVHCHTPCHFSPHLWNGDGVEG